MVSPEYALPGSLDYSALERLVRLTFPALDPYTFFIQRSINHALDDDYRWLNTYKMCEMRYASSAPGHKLINSSDWRSLLKRHEHVFTSHMRPKQTVWGFLEEIRAAAAHSIVGQTTPRGTGIDHRIGATLAPLQRVAMDIVNELPGNPGLRFHEPVPDPGAEGSPEIGTGQASPVR